MADHKNFTVANALSSRPRGWVLARIIGDTHKKVLGASLKGGLDHPF
jgi:hypothetical protein